MLRRPFESALAAAIRMMDQTGLSMREIAPINIGFDEN
jgi:hypothetical protein